MKFFIALFALFAAASAQIITTGGLYAPYAGVLPSSRLTRSDWVQPGVRYNVPAVARYTSITPGFTTLHQSTIAAPVLAAPAPLYSAGLIGGHYTAGLAAPIAAWPYIRK